MGVCGEGCADFAPIFGITSKICRQCKHISRVFVILLIVVPAAPLILDLSYHRHQRSSDLLDFRISVSQLSSFCLPSIGNWCQASSHRLKISAVGLGSSEASIVKVPAETVPSPVEEVPCAGPLLPPCLAFTVPSLNCCGTCVVSRALFGIHRPFFQFPNVHKKTPDAKSFSILRTPLAQSLTPVVVGAPAKSPSSQSRSPFSIDRAVSILLSGCCR